MIHGLVSLPYLFFINFRSLILFGACGGYGFDSKETKGMVTGTRYWRTGENRDVLLWSSKVHVRVNLTDTDHLLVAVGQSGLNGCQKVSVNLAIVY